MFINPDRDVIIRIWLNDWYRLTVKDGDSFDKVRLNISSSSTTNGCKFEIYKNLVSNYYAMLRIGYGTGGEVALDAGTYYIRVVSTNTVDNFNAGDIPTYKLSVSQTTKVDKVTVTSTAITDSNGYYEMTFYLKYCD